MPRRAVFDSSAYDAPPEGRFDKIRLDFNESTSPVPGCHPEGMPPSWVSAYPEYGTLLQLLASKFGLTKDNVTITNGSDEAISLISNTFIEFGQDRALISNPCFFMIKQCLRLAGAKLEEVSVQSNLEFDLGEIETRLKTSPKLAMFATPDNPTGSAIPHEEIKRWCATYPEVLFVIDEAYGEYAGTTVIPLVKQFDNLLVIKTFSKAWGMAGFRLGMIVGKARLLEFINRVKLPYSVNSAAVFTALKLLENEKYVEERVAESVKLRSRLASFLKSRGFFVKETNANWCLLGAGMQAAALTSFASQKGILIRNRSTSQFAKFGVELQDTLQTKDGKDTRTELHRKLERKLEVEQELEVEREFEVERAAERKTPPMWGLIRVSTGSADELTAFETLIDEFRTSFALIFDLDGTLVDTSKSFDKTVKYLVERHSGAELSQDELTSLRLEGGYNDDWVATRELLRRRGKDVALSEIARDGETFYLSIAKESEELLVSLDALKRLRTRHPLFIVTGRSRREYAPVWGEKLDEIFERVYCVDDVAGLRAKPSPDYLLQALKDSGITRGAYVGNAVDDIQAARSAGLTAIGVTCGRERDALIRVGAQAIISNCSQMEELLNG